MKILIKLTETALVGETLKEVPVTFDPFEIAALELGTQKTTVLPIVGKPNTMPVTILTLKSGRKLSVKETVEQILQAPPIVPTWGEVTIDGNL